MVGATLPGGGGVELDITWIRKLGSEATACWSVTEMVIALLMPTSLAVGVPVTRPVWPLIDAQAGRFSAEKVSASPSGSAAVGWNTYAVPLISCVVGVPPMTGGRLLEDDESSEAPPPQAASTRVADRTN